MKEEVRYKIINRKNGRTFEPSETEQKVLHAMTTYLDGREQFLNPLAERSSQSQPTGLTEDTLLSLKLQAERLQKLDVNMEVHEEWLVPMKIGSSLSEQPEFIYDGGQLVGRLRKRVKCNTSYVRTPQWTLGTFSETLQKDYYIREMEDGSFQMTAENVLSQVEVYDRSCDYWDDKSWSWEKLGVAFSLFCLGSFGLIHLISLVVFVLSVLGIVNSDALGLAFILWLASVFGVVPLALYDLKKFSSYKRRKASAQVVQRIRSSIPEFCINDFVSMAESRIKSIFYAGRMEKVAHFVNCDLHGFLVRHAYVVNCETMYFWFLDFGQEGDNQYIDARVMVRLTSKAQGHTMIRGIQYVKVRFTRPVNGIMTGDWYIEKMEVLK